MSLDLTHEMSQNFIDYAAAVNMDRAIPDVTGLKPVARRILYGAYANGRTSSKPYVKNARIVGDVMGSYHPHGDSSIYEALVRLSQDWVMRYPLIDFHGNQGSINGDGPAAHRYTEGRLAKLSEEGLLAGIKKNNVPFMPTYDDADEEPTILPAIFPNLLCNPNAGIGVAMACKWGCHNLKEVEKAILAYMNGEEPSLPGPDFPTGGVVINKNDFANIMKSGKGSVKVRAKYSVKGQIITITEIPYETTIEKILDDIDSVTETDNMGISEVLDQTNNKGVKILIKCNRDTNPEVVMRKLFAKTDLQKSYAYTQVAFVNKVTTLMSLKDCCKTYVEHNIECIRREVKFDLDAAEARLHIVEGLLIALEDIDNVIQLIKKSENSTCAAGALCAKYGLDDVQAKAILAMRLSSLAKLEKIELEQEKKELVEKIADMKAILADVERIKDIIKERLHKIVEKYGDDRRTELLQLDTPTKEEKEIVYVEPEKCIVTMTESGLIKRIPATSFRTQRKNGKGVKTTGDITVATIRTNTIDSLMIFTNKGKMYRVLVDNIPVGTNVSVGTSVHALVEMEPGEEPSLIYSIVHGTDAKYVLFVTQNGVIKKTSLEEFTKTRKRTGLAAINLAEGDHIVSVSLLSEEDIVIMTRQGMGIKFKSTDVSPTGRTASGVKGINLNPDDYVIAALPIRDANDSLGIFNVNGSGKKIKLSELVTQKRGGKGIKLTKTEVAGGALISDEDSVLIIGTNNSICISAKEVPLLSRASVGNALIKGDINSISKI